MISQYVYNCAAVAGFLGRRAVYYRIDYSVLCYVLTFLKTENQTENSRFCSGIDHEPGTVPE